MRRFWPLHRKASAAGASGGLCLQPAIKDVVFIHVPKTAGTSLRNSLVEAMPDAVKVFWYGPNTGLIKGDFINASGREARTPSGVLALRRRFTPEQRLLLAGHFRAANLVHCFHPASFITFLRNPVDRVVSTYRHHVRHMGYEGSFADFYQSPRYINTLSRLLSGVDLRHVGFVGLTEHMRDMLPALSRHLGVELRNRKDNVDRGSGRPIIDDRTRARIMALNEEDLRLYRLVEADLDGYTNYRSRNIANPAKGEVRSQGGGSFAGWAAAVRPEGLVEIEVRVGDQVVHRCFADQFLPDLRSGVLAPHGVGGFSVRLPAGMLTGQRQVRFVFAGSDEDLVGSPVLP
jgi:hypothetical protein